MSDIPGSLAFDFDGVLCNGLKEYFQTAWRVYGQVWSVSSPHPPVDLQSRFETLRPVVEVGWEMPVVLRAVIRGATDAEVLSHWPTLRAQIVESESLDTQDIGQRVDSTRDQWIQDDLEGWLDQHEFYPGVIERLKTLQRHDFPFVIVTTKESRFVKQLLQRAEIALDHNKIFGKDCKRPKPRTLRLLQSSLPGPIWFIEDRVAALRAVLAEPDLKDIQLFLADWGYNIERDRMLAAQDPSMTCLSLQKFVGECTQWKA